MDATTAATRGSAPAAEPFATTPHGFARGLLERLSASQVALPSFPAVVERVKQTLDDDRATHAQIARVISADAALAARVLRIANSATFNAGGTPVTELSTAVSRLGHELVRCVAVSFALRQMKQFGDEPELRPQLQELWRKGTLVGALCYVLARATRAANPDAALVTGLLHNVGRLYLVAGAHAHDPALPRAPGWDEVLQDWHPRFARAILAHWKFPDTVCAAVAGQNGWAREQPPEDALSDVLVAALLLVPCVWYRDLLPDTVGTIGAFRRLRLEVEDCRRLLGDCAEQIRQLRDALSGA